MMYALILLVWAQGALSVTPRLVRYDIEPVPFASEQACKAAAGLALGPIMAETNAQQYAWRDAACVAVAP